MSQVAEGIGRERLVILAGLMLAVLMAAMDQTIVAAALPDILSDLGASQDKITWIITAYLIMQAASTPLYGRLSDMYGRKPLFLGAIVIFWVASGLCGVAQNATQLTLFRAIQGIGGGGLISLALTIIGDIFSPRERGQYISGMFILIGIATILGPLLGGWLTDHYTWRLIFAINLPIGLLAIAVIEPTLNLPVPDEDHTIDYLGVLFLFLTTVAVIVVSEKGSDWGWDSWRIGLLIVTAVVALALFLLQEHASREPILPLELFRNRVVAAAIGLSFCAGIGRLLVINYIPTFLQYTQGVSSTTAGALIAPMIIGMVGFSFIVGNLMTRTGRYKPFPVMGAVFGAVGFFLLSTIHGGTSFSTLAIYLFITGAGFGLIMPVLTTASQNAVRPEYLGVVTTIITYLRTLAGGLGVSIYGTLYSNSFSEMMVRIAGRGQGRGALDPVLLHTPQYGRALRDDIVRAVSLSMDQMFLYLVPVMAVAFVIALLLPELSLSQQSNVEEMESDDGTDGTDARPTSD